MLKTARRLFIVLLFALCNLLFVIPAFAQVNPYATPQTNPDVPQNMHTWTQMVLLEVLSAATCQLGGIDPINPKHACLGVDQLTGKIGYTKPATETQTPGGMIGFTANFMTSLFTLPVHTSDYLSYLGQNFGVVKKTYAQSSGIDSLSPLIPLWVVFRNIVYVGFVIVFVIVGLAIMLRLKIDPRTVMSVENQIPKIIIGLVLVTFSMAISGLLIDLMYTSTYLTFNTIATSGINPDAIKDLNPGALQGRFPLDAFGGVGGVFGISNTLAGASGDMIKKMLSLSPGGDVLPKRLSPISLNVDVNIDGIPPFVHVTKSDPIISPNPEFLNLGGRSATDWVVDIGSFAASLMLAQRIIPDGDILGLLKLPASLVMWPFINSAIRDFLPFGIAFVIILIALLWALLRLAFELLKAYIFILLDIVLAPFWIVLGLFPGSPISFSAWLKDIIANLSVFPVTIGMFLLGTAFRLAIKDSTVPTFVPPMVGSSTNIEVLASLIGLGIILMTPQVLNMMKDAIKAPQLKYTAAIGQAVGVGAGAVNLPEHAQKFGQFMYYSSYIKNFPGLGRFFKDRHSPQAA